MESRVMWFCVYRNTVFDQCCHGGTDCHQVLVTIEEMEGEKACV